MKKTTKKLLRYLFVAALILSFSTVSTFAAVVLEIDVSSPSHAKFQATGAFAQNDDIEDTFLDEGFTLLDFFESSAFGGPEYFETSNLYSPGGNFAYSTLFVVSIIGNEDRDLNIAGSGFSTQDFSILEPAFYNSATADLSVWMSLIQVGKTGDILAGDSGYNTVVIGQYAVVPEPECWMLFVGGCLLIGLVGVIRSRKFSV